MAHQHIKIRAYLKAHHKTQTVKQIAAHFNVTDTCIRDNMRALEMKGAERKRVEDIPALHAAIEKYAHEGTNYIVQSLGCAVSPNQVRYHAKQIQIDITKVRGANKNPRKAPVFSVDESVYFTDAKRDELASIAITTGLPSMHATINAEMNTKNAKGISGRAGMKQHIIDTLQNSHLINVPWKKLYQDIRKPIRDHYIQQQLDKQTPPETIVENIQRIFNSNRTVANGYVQQHIDPTPKTSAPLSAINQFLSMPARQALGGRA